MDSIRAPLALAALLLITFVAYYPALSAGFIWDDDAYLTDNPLVRTLDGLKRIWTTADAPQYYPLCFTTFWVEYQLWGYEPPGYHAVNILLHALNAFLVGRILVLLGVRGAWWIALLFALHPVHVESVAWITERKNVLSGLFYLLSMLAYLRGEQSGRKALYAGSLVLFACALLSKTVTMTLPLALALILLWRNGRLTRDDALKLAPFLGAGAAISLLTVGLESGMVDVVAADFVFSRWERVLVACRALLFYPFKLIVPYPLIFNYPRWELQAGGWSQVWPLLDVLLISALLVYLWRAGRRGAVYAALFYAITISPALGFFDVYPFRYSFVADHFQYLASLGVLILLVQAALLAGDRLQAAASARTPRTRRGAPPEPAQPGIPGRTLGTVVLIVLAVLTWVQARAYRDAETLWRDTIAKNSNSWIAHNNLAGILLDAGRNEEALESYERAVRSKPTSAESHTGRGIALSRLGRDDEALEALDRAIGLDPTYPQAYLNRADVLLRAGRFELAASDLDAFLQHNPDRAPAYRSRARAHAELGRHDRALEDVDTAIRLDPRAEDYSYRAALRFIRGQHDEALADLATAIGMNPADPAPYLSRALIYVQLRRYDEARDDIDRFIDSAEPVAASFILRGRILHAISGDESAGCPDWKRACDLGDCSAFEARCNR